MRTSTAEEIRIMKVHVGLPPRLFPPEEQPGIAEDSVPLSLGQTEPSSGAGGKEEDLGSAAELVWGAGHILLPWAALICPALLMQPSISRKQGNSHSGTSALTGVIIHIWILSGLPSLCPALCSGQQELGSPLVIRAAVNSSCPVPNQDLNIS